MTTCEPYDLIPEVAAVMDDDHWEDGAPFERRTDTLANIDYDVRCDQLLRSLRNLDARRAILLAEKDRLQAKLNAAENRRDEVRAYLQSTMELTGTRKVKTPIATASISAGREKIVLDEDRIEQHIANWPSEVVTKVVTYPPPKVSKTALAHLDNAVLLNLPGVSVELGDDVLTIR